MIARNNLKECCLSSHEDVRPEELTTGDNLTFRADVSGACNLRTHPPLKDGRSQSSGSVMSVAEVTDAGTAAMNAGQAPANVVSIGPGPALVNQLLQIPGKDGQEWSSRLGSSIPRKSWESL